MIAGGLAIGARPSHVRAVSDNPSSPDHADELNAMLGGWNAAMGIHHVRATRDEVVLEMTVGDVHRQPYGVVHGGVYAGLVETACSVGAALDARAHRMVAGGLENSTAFLAAVREGRLRVEAKPLSRGRRTQVWQATIHDERGRAVASGRVRLLVIDPGIPLAGEPPKVER